MAAGTGDGEGYQIRLLSPADDLAALTEMLHRAYGALARRGMRFWASHQSVEDTRKRVGQGECWVAASGGVIVGTIVLKDTTKAKSTPWYERPDVTCFNQFAVEPAWQGRGLGSKLIELVERRAREKGLAELALDTAEGADDLIAYYLRRGYRFIEHVSWNGVNYRSVILSKRLT